VRLWNRSKNIKKTQASIERGRQARKRRAANPLPESEPIEFQTAPRKRTAAATPSRASSRIGKLKKLTAAEKQQIEDYNPRRNREKLKKSIRMHILKSKLKHPLCNVTNNKRNK
jgi:hypothetical protein